jgi:signal transduction histidine kinase
MVNGQRGDTPARCSLRGRQAPGERRFRCAQGSEVRLRAFEVVDDVRFEVVDSGMGTAGEHLARVFEKFYRIPGSSSDGAGLGLSIAREIVMAHGGGIVFESNLGAGATSWFTLPIANAQSFAEIGA